MSNLVLENEQLRVVVAPAYGARVVSLVRKASGRDWMTQGAPSRNVGEDAAYGGAEAVGWDECFPTVSPWDASATPWRRRLRDHGDLWGRPFAVDFASATAVRLSFAAELFRFGREFRLDDDTLAISYEVENRTGAPLPYLWALHALLAIREGDRIVLPGVDRLQATYVSLGGEAIAATAVSWPDATGVLPFRLDVVQPKAAVFAGKFFARGDGGRAMVGQPGEWLEISWPDSIRDLGIWMTYGGWPAAGGNSEIALEPTSARADHLGQAIDADAAALAPGERRQWWIRMQLKP